MRVGYGIDARFANHHTGAGHPERRERILGLLEMIERYPHSGQLDRIAAREASQDELALVHTPSHIATIAATSGKRAVRLDPDTTTSERSYDVARLAAGLVVEMAERIITGRLQRGFAFVRPPGHHAEPDRAMGFCLFNNIALAAQAALQHGLSRVAVVDYDVHHGNGTQAAFYGSPAVLFVSSHQFPFYPGTGDFSETGEGAGRGFTLNFPLPAGCGDSVYVPLYRDVIVRLVEQYKPQLILVSAGFDAYRHDPLAGMNVSQRGFSEISRVLIDCAGRCCQGKILFVLEGGYDVAGLQLCAGHVLDRLLGLPAEALRIDPASGLQEYYEKMEGHFSEFWDLRKIS